LLQLDQENGAEHHHHDHEAAQAIVLTTDKPLSWEDFDRWLRPFRLSLGEKLLRMKGLLKTAESEPPIVVHGVEHVLHAPVRLSAWPDSNQSTCLVFVVAPDAPNILVQSWNDLVA
jgi:G3E family GTPase